MRRLLVALTFICSCSGGRTPEGASDSARFLLIEPSTAPACGATVPLTAVGEMPDLDALADRDAWLFQLPAQIDGAAAGDPITVFFARDDVAEWGSGLVPVPGPEQVWHWTGDRFNIVSLSETTPMLSSYRLLEKPSCFDVVKSLCEVDEVTPCDDFERFDVRIPSTSQGIGVGVAVEDGVVLVSSADHAADGQAADFYLVSELTNERVTNTSTLTPYGGAFVADDGVAWIYGPKGRFATWTDATGFVPLLRPDYESGFVQTWLDGARGGAPFELFALSDGGALERFDGTSWKLVYPGFEFLEHEGGVVWLAPGHAISIGSILKGVIRYKDGVTTEEDLGQFGLSARISAVAKIPGIGAMVGTIAGEIFVDDGTGWRRFDEGPRDGLEVNGLLPYRDGFVFGREIEGFAGGWAVQYVPGFGLCPAVRVSEADLRRLSPMGEHSFVVIGKEMGVNSWVSIVRGSPTVSVCE